MPTIKRKAARKPIRYIEHAHQCAVIQWARYIEKSHPEVKYLFAIPNGLLGKLTIPQRARAKAEGYKAGPPDLMLPLVIPGEFSGLWIEMKSPEERDVKGGGLTDSQNDFRTQLIAEGYEHKVCYGSQEAIEVLTAYLARYRTVRRFDVPRGANRKGEERRAGT
jgi:hypothetical protein